MDTPRTSIKLFPALLLSAVLMLSFSTTAHAKTFRGTMKRDVVTGTKAADVFKFGQRDGRRDIIRCGKGRDVAYIRTEDRVSGCERVYRLGVIAGGPTKVSPVPATGSTPTVSQHFLLSMTIPQSTSVQSIAVKVDVGRGWTASQMRLAGEDGNWQAWKPFASPTNFVLNGGSGIRGVFVQLRNASGVESNILFAKTMLIGSTTSSLVNTVRPSVSGNALVGAMLFSDPGVWSDLSAVQQLALPIQTSLQWERCSAGTASSSPSCFEIVGATSPQRVSTSDDAGKWLRIKVTATSVTSVAVAYSDLKGPFTTTCTSNCGGGGSGTVANVTAPVASGTAAVGSTITTTDGTWSYQGSPVQQTNGLAISYRWQRCIASSVVQQMPSCTDISGASGKNYLVASADAGYTLRAIVTATAGGASASKDSNSIGPVTSAPAPDQLVGLKSVTPPVISGGTSVNSQLTATSGTWQGMYQPPMPPCPPGMSCTQVMPALYGASLPALTFSYRWERCSSSACVTVGTNSANYTTNTADASHTLRVVVTASAAGSGPSQTIISASATSSLHGPIVAPPPPPPPPPPAPSQTGDPTVSGTTEVPYTLSANHGSWSGATSINHVWQDDNGAEFGGDGSLTLNDSHAGDRIRIKVTACNATGCTTGYSGYTENIRARYVPPPPPEPQVVTVNLTVQRDHNDTVATVSWNATANKGSVMYCQSFIGGAYHADTSPSGGPQFWTTNYSSVRFVCYGDQGGVGEAVGA